MTTQLPKLMTRNAWLAFLLTVFFSMLGFQAHSQCPIDARFTASNVYICQGQSITFTNTSTGSPTFFSWAENTVSFSSAANPVRTFPTPGSYLIQFVASNGTCLDSASTLVIVAPNISSTATFVSPTCFNGTNGSINLTPSAGTPNISLDNVRSTNGYTTADAVGSAGYSGGITVEAWVKPRATWTTGDGLFAAFNYATGTVNRFFIGYNPDFQQFVFYDDNLGNQFQTGISPRGAWYHVAVTVSPTNQMNMYINGVLRRTSNTNGGWMPQTGDWFTIGQEWDYAAPNFYPSQHFDGNIDEMRIWNSVLAPSTIASNYSGCMSVNATHPNWANLVAYYSFNEGSGGFVFDRSGHGRHGTRVNGNGYATVPQTNWGCFNSGTGYGYNWSNGATVQDPTSLAAGTYSVTITDGAGCTRVQSVTLTNPAQVVVTTNPSVTTPICIGNSVNLTASGALSYTWSPATGLSGTTGATVSANPTVTRTYTVTGANLAGCTGSTTIQVVVNALPVATITGIDTICVGDTTTLVASGGTSYAWSNGPTAASNSVNPSSNTTYTVTVTDNNTCQSTTQISVAVNALPTVSITGTDTICLGDTTTLTAAGGTSYAWSNGPTIASQSLSPSTSSNYVVTVTDANTCENTGSITVTVNALPVLSFTGNDTICMGDTTLITASGASTFLWGTGASTAAVSLSPSSFTVYTVTGTDGNGCVGEDSVAVVVNALPTASITGADTICEGTTTTLTGAGGTSYLWSNAATTSTTSVGPTTSTTYMLTVTDLNGCTNDASHLVFVNAAPVASIAGQDSICLGDTITLIASGGNTYVWSTAATTFSIAVSPTASGTYSVTATDNNGCEGIASHVVTVNALPATPVITQSGNTLSTTTGFASYQWYLNGAPISGATSNSFGATLDGNYTVEVTNAQGCSATSASFPFIFVSIQVGTATGIDLTVYPNPNQGQFVIQLDLDQALDVNLRIYDLVGKQVWSKDAALNFGEWKQTVDLSQLSSGTYLIEVLTEKGRMSRKVVVE